MHFVHPNSEPEVDRVSTGIKGLDQVLGGGVPSAHSVLVSGPAGSGKSLIGAALLIEGAAHGGEKGVLMSFEEDKESILRNFGGFNWPLEQLVSEGRILIDPVELDSVAGNVVGEFDLSALKMRILARLESVSATRLVLDGISHLMSALNDESVMRRELLALLADLKQRGVTVFCTSEARQEGGTRLGFEEYLCDAFIRVEQRVNQGVARRILRVVKCRGVAHSNREHPFSIGVGGIELFPVEATTLDHPASEERISLGIADVDALLYGGGVYVGSSILVTGAAGCGKSTLGCAFATSRAANGGRALVVSFEESPSQIVRNMRGIGIDLETPMKAGKLVILPLRSGHMNCEGHLLAIQSAIEALGADTLVVDPISSLASVGSIIEVELVVSRLVDFCKTKSVTTMLLNLQKSAAALGGDTADLAVSSAADVWIRLRTVEHTAERSNVLQVVKARGTPHSTAMMEFNFGGGGFEMVAPFIDERGVALGSQRVLRAEERRQQIQSAHAEFDLRALRLRKEEEAMEASLVAMRIEHEAKQAALEAERQQFEAQRADEAVGAERARRARAAPSSS